MADALPFSNSSLKITAADGETYDMSDPASRQNCVDSNTLLYFNKIASEIKIIDSDALVTIG